MILSSNFCETDLEVITPMKSRKPMGQGPHDIYINRLQLKSYKDFWIHNQSNGLVGCDGWVLKNQEFKNLTCYWQIKSLSHFNFITKYSSLSMFFNSFTQHTHTHIHYNNFFIDFLCFHFLLHLVSCDFFFPLPKFQILSIPHWFAHYICLFFPHSLISSPLFSSFKTLSSSLSPSLSLVYFLFSKF